MRTAKGRRNRTAAAVLLSIAMHVAVLTYFAIQSPHLHPPEEEAGPPEPIIPVLIMPRTPPPAPGATATPSPIRLHRRQLHPEAPPPPTPPLIVPPAPATPAAPAAAPPPRPLPNGSTVQPSPSAQLGSVLRGSVVGCANPDLLSPAERARCEERLGHGAGQAPTLGLGLSAEKQGDLDRAAEHNATCQKYRNSGALSDYPGLRNGGC